MKTSKNKAGWFRVGGNLYRRGSQAIYYARYERNGKESWKSLKTKVRVVAKAKLAELENKLMRSPRQQAAAGPAPTLATLIEKCLLKWSQRRDYKSFDSIKYRLEKVARSYLGKRLITRIEAEQIESFLLNLKSHHRRTEKSLR
ncbi:MAG: hypothetical protein AAGK14_08975 [Verrucomicrobiota bacterium]